MENPESRQGLEIFSSPPRPDWLRDPPIFLSNGYQVVKRPGREADHSLLSSAEVKERVDLYLHSANTSS